MFERIPANERLAVYTLLSIYVITGVVVSLTVPTGLLTLITILGYAIAGIVLVILYYKWAIKTYSPEPVEEEGYLLGSSNIEDIEWSDPHVMRGTDHSLVFLDEIANFDDEFLDFVAIFLEKEE